MTVNSLTNFQNMHGNEGLSTDVSAVNVFVQAVLMHSS